eukprot:5249729-Amphidinium_carterae.1
MSWPSWISHLVNVTTASPLVSAQPKQTYYYEYYQYPSYGTDDMSYDHYYEYSPEDETVTCVRQQQYGYALYYYYYIDYDGYLGQKQAKPSADPTSQPDVHHTSWRRFLLTDVTSILSLLTSVSSVTKSVQSSGYATYYSMMCEGTLDTSWTAMTGSSLGSGALFWVFTILTTLVWNRLKRWIRATLGRFVHLGVFCQMFASETTKDAKRATVLVGVCCCDLALLIVKRVPHKFGRRLARKLVLRARNSLHQSTHTEDGEVTTVNQSAAYRPLFAIQNGGYYKIWIQSKQRTAWKARWGGNRRWTAVHPRRPRIVFNPRKHGECLFQAFNSVAVDAGRSPTTSRTLRKQAQQRLREVYLNHEPLAGRYVPQWAEKLGLSTKQLVEGVFHADSRRKTRWGNTLDLYVLSELHCIPVHVLDISRLKWPGTT